MLFFPFTLVSQVGGKSAFSFVNIENSPRIEAIGGSAIAIFDNDVSLSQSTPSLLNRSMDKELVFCFGDYFADINLFAFSYAQEYKEVGVISVSVKTINYGDFHRNDEMGNENGNFTAQDQVLTLGIGKELSKSISLGINISFLSSQYEVYKSFAIASNLSGTYFNKDNQFTSTFLIKNLGRQLNYYASEKERLPFELQFAISKELVHLPFRYHLTYHNLQNFNIKSPYKLTSQTNLETGKLEIKEETMAKTALRHIVIGGELNPFRKSFYLRGGFNFQRRFDLSLVTKPAMVGFSWGVGFKVTKFRFDYSRSSYHLSGSPNNFSIAGNLSTFGL